MARKKRSEQDVEASAGGPGASANGAVADVPESAESSGGGLGRLLFLLLVAAILALALSEDLRAKVLDLLFGAEEEFDYSSTTMPAQDAPVGAQAS
jgi:hypothetical protein